MQEISVDLVVIGSGPAGQTAAIQAAKLGKQVIVVEKDTIGGASLNSGTIPSKSLREAVIALTNFNERYFDVRRCNPGGATVNDLNSRLHRILKEKRELLQMQFDENKILVFKGRGQLKNEHLVEVTLDGQITHLIHAQFIILGSGSKPRTPLNVPFDKDVILDSTALLSMDQLPKSMIVLGAGIVGTEYASFFAALGVQVTLVDRKERLLGFLDREIGDLLHAELAQIGLRFIGGKEPAEIRRVEDRAFVSFSDKTTLEAEVLLYSLGRVANSDELGLGNTGLAVDKSGFIPVNALFQTEKTHIYAVGDLIGPPALASTSMEQGRLAARHAFGQKTHHFPTFYPIGIYTIPEISYCGYTEEELVKMGYHYQVGRANYSELARAHIDGGMSGLFKILFHAETLEILGVHIVGRGATEVIHVGQLAMTFHAHLDFFIDHIFNYPTHGEGYRIAALNGVNKIKEREKLLR